jgi:pimeloyl-ACP methyl ester carboxylesterase
MPALAAAGCHVVAPDQRGYGRTTGWDADYDGDLRSFRLLNLVVDALALVSALGVGPVRAVVGHDFGASVAAWCAVARPDVFRSVALMSAPFGGPPALAAGMSAARISAAAPSAAGPDIHAALAALPRPRKHYQWYYGTRAANADMWRCPQGVAAFLRAYFHHKSADWPGNRPEPLRGWTAEELARLPDYYVMDLDRNMAETVAPHMPGPAEAAACGWLSEAELAVYAAEYGRTGFQGGLQWYRCRTEGVNDPDLRVFAGRGIDVPSVFIAGAQDWGIHQAPGAIERMREGVCTRMLGCHLVDGAGHWVQQERPEAVAALLLEFLRDAG